MTMRGPAGAASSRSCRLRAKTRMASSSARCRISFISSSFRCSESLTIQAERTESSNHVSAGRPLSAMPKWPAIMASQGEARGGSSETTAAFDRGRKFELYREIDTLTHYLLVEQNRQHVDLFVKNEQGQWVLHPFWADDTIVIDRLGKPWPVATLYEDVEFTPPTAPAASA